MKQLLKILTNNGKEGVELYKKSLIDNDRVATGQTKDSIRSEVKGDSKGAKLIFYALDHIRDLETGQTPEQIKSNPPLFQDITRWAIARGINRTSNSIIRGLMEKGYEGTAGLITSVDEKIETNVLNDIKRGIKSDILDTLKVK